jgi:hypothetical protein
MEVEVMARPRRRVVRMDEVKIEREGNYVSFNYKDPEMGGTRFEMSPDMMRMSDEELLDFHNQHIRDLAAFAQQHRGRPLVEIVGRPQIEYFKEGYHWVPRGDVLRCVIGWDDRGGALVEIDDKVLTMEEFGHLLLSREGWGMRIAFVEEDELHKSPKIEVRSKKE